jgi:archaemetzincin
VTTSIHIINTASHPVSDLDHISHTLKRIFHLPVDVTGGNLDIDRAFDGSRRQYNSTALISHILASTRCDGKKILGLVDVDLFVPVLTFVFGEAQFTGCAAVVSSFRLGNQFYGLESDTILLRDRLEKEIVHELGHTFGLYHCKHFDCVMRSSTYVEEIDLKSVELCTACNEKFHHTTTI